MVVYFPILPLLKWTGQDPTSQTTAVVSLLPYLAYFIWGYIQFFRPQNRFLGALKALLVYNLGYLLYIFVVGILVSIWVFATVAR